MHIRRAIPNTRCHAGIPWRPRRGPTSSIRSRPEFPRVNAHAGVEPIRPELSGLKLRRAAVPRRVTRLLIRLAYQWRPSEEYRRRQVDMRLMNVVIRQMDSAPTLPPPVLSYEERADVAATRLQPMLDPAAWDSSLRDLQEDLTHFEEEERRRRAPLIQPRLTEPEPAYLLSYRPLLPRQYRHFLRFSPYPRIAASVAAVAFAGTSFFWLSSLQQQAAVASGQARVVRHTFEAQLAAARGDGVDRRGLRRLERQASALRALGTPPGFIPTRSRVRFYRQQAGAYAALLRDLRRLERRALGVWRGREARAYLDLVEATQGAAGAGLPLAVPAIPACSTSRCYRAASLAERSRAAWLRQTARTLAAYGRAVAAAPDVYGAATGLVQEADNLVTTLPRAAVPMPIARLDALYASAGDDAAYARVGALARLDRDVLAEALARRLPRRAVVVSAEAGTLTCYQRGKAVFTTAITAGRAVPTGVFHLQARVPALAATYWDRSGTAVRYRSGEIPDWMPFSGSAALQGAPWRLAFGPGSSGAVQPYLPDTPASIDLPPRAAAVVYSWTRTGTEVVVY